MSTEFHTRNPLFRQKTLEAFDGQLFARLLGMDAVDAGAGWFEVRLAVESRHTQHDGVVHGGVTATIADTCVALAAHTLVADGERVLTIEFKINYLRAARGGILVGRGQVLRAGRTVTVSEAEVYSVADGRQTLAAKAMATVAIVPAPIGDAPSAIS